MKPKHMDKRRPAPSFRRGKAPQGGDEGLLTFTEIAIGSVLISLLILTAVSVLKVTEMGTVRQKKSQQALNLAKEKVEDLKNYVNSVDWRSLKVDVRFPPTQTPEVAPYNLYPPVTVELERSSFIVDPEVRYVRENFSTGEVEPLPTPGTVDTPEVSQLVRVRADVYYGPPEEYVPLPTVEWNDPANPYFGKDQNRQVYSNLVAEKFIGTRQGGKIVGVVQYQACGLAHQPVTHIVELAAYQNDVKVATTLSDPVNGLFVFEELPYGPTSVAVAAAQPVSFVGYCGIHPVTVGPSPQNVKLRLANIPVTTIRGVVVYASPTPPVQWTPEPYPTPPSDFVPVPNAFVAVNDGISKPVTSSGSGAFTIVNVRATPVPVPTWYNVSGQTASFSGTGFYKHDPAVPVTVVLHEPAAMQAVTVWFSDWWGNPPDSNFYPVTLTAVDSLGVAVTVVAAYPATLTPPLTVHVGRVDFSWKLNDATPKGYQADPFSYTVTLGMGSPIPAPAFVPVGTAAGTIFGLGTFDYGVFRVNAREVGGCHEVPDIPVSWSGGATFGTFRSDVVAVRCVTATADSEQYRFLVDTGGGDYSSSEETMLVEFDDAVTLNPGLEVLPRNAYLHVVVNRGGERYAHGAFIGALEGAGVALPVGLGAGFTASRFFSTSTTGTGEAKFPVRLYSNPVTYTLHVRVVDPMTGSAAVTSRTVVLDSADTFSAPQTETFNF